MSHGYEQVIRQEQDLACKGAGAVTGGSGASQVGMETWLVQVLMTSLVAEPVIGREVELACGTPCGVRGGSGAVEVGMDTSLVQLLVMSQGLSRLPGRSISCLVELLVMSLVAQELFR